ncbi:pro-neuregulin-1, membrane-bound isoform isoform X8 [Hypomesus transpacificus]|uniref:pro-neuregulin-1, membrane-bound isoform isoform X8 n=1 Tax=Hypomesus transpacificus TaxID=137520 RepID=UPI001F078C74|nr:pro-neuregulin-1, membrane-bound isoform isoform X8 [Hypomesus transpacificus]
MTEGVEDSSSGLVIPPGAASPSGSTAIDPGRVPQETPEEAVAGGEADDEGGERNIDGGNTERRGPLGLLGLAGSCCVCVEMEQLRSCLHSEKICILPILACLLSLALCTAGLKWVFVDKIFEYEPPTHLDPKRMGQDPIIFAEPTQGFPVSLPHPSSTPGPTTTFTTTGQPEVLIEGKPTGVPFLHKFSQVTPTSALMYHTNLPIQTETLTTPKPVKKGAPTSNHQPTLESNDIVPKLSATSTTPAAKTSSHVTRCSDSHQNYCVNGGECFTLEVIPGSTKFLCRCKTGFTGKRCEENVPVRVINPKQAEELYQKRVLTITGICIALLVVGIMCVVAYCKTKKQRKKLHDRLRQSLRNDRKSMTNGPQIPNTPLENVQLVNQYTSKKAMPAHNVIEKETETSFSTSQYTSSAHQSPMVTHTTSQSWSNGQSGSVLSDSRAILVMSSVESSLHATPSRRGRLNATGGARDLSAYLKNLRHSPGSCRDSPYSERYISTMTSPNCSPPVDIASPVTPGSPPSEVSAPLSSLATSVPSVAVSPSGEEERPLLFAIPPRSKENLTREDHSQYKRISAHYNHGHETHSPPPRIVEHDKYESTQEYVTTTINMAYFPAQSIPKKLEKTNNNNGQRAKRTMANGHVDHKMESNSSSCGSSESETEDERVGEDTPFLSIQIPVAVTLDTALRPTDSSRTNPALQLSPQDDLQARLSCVIVNQDPIAV